MLRGVRRSRACMRVCLRACLGWPNFGHIRDAVIGLRKKELIAELGNSYVVTDILTVTRSDSIISRPPRVGVVESIHS